MRAMVFMGPSQLELQDIAAHEPGDGEVVVAVEASGICGSELHGIRHPGFRKPPLVMGHEFSGTTDDGRRVTVNPLISCGSCDLCRRGSDHLCRHRQIIGIHRPGAFAEQVVVPASAVHDLDDDMSFETGAMVEPLANAVHALRLADPNPNDRIGVIGAGTIGLMALLVARQQGAEVVVTDLAPSRRQLAERLGATSTGAELDGEFDIVIDAVGAVTTHHASVAHLRPGGTAVWLGLLSPAPGFDGQEIVRQEKRVVGSYCYTGSDFAAARVLAGTLPLGWASSFPMGEGVEVFYELMNGRADVVKALLRP